MAVGSSAHDRLGRQIDQDGAEQGQRDADAAQDEVFPGRLDRRVRAIDADHQHRGQRGAASTATHIRPMLLANSARFMANIRTWIHRVVEAQVSAASAGRSRARARYSWR